jgi:lambda family phage portal protein
MAAQNPQSENAMTAMQKSMREARADYNAAKPSRFRRKRLGVQSTGSGADYHYRTDTDYFGIIEQARDAERNDSLIGRIVDSAVTNTIQSGFKLDPQTGDEALDMMLWEMWEAWASDPDQCDIAGEFSFHDFECLNLRRVMFDGDIVILPLDSGELQMIEAHRVRTPRKTKDRIIHGVQLDSVRRRLAYYITKDDIDPLAVIPNNAEMFVIQTRDAEGNRQVLHIYDPKRCSQTRGVSALAPIIDPAAMRDDIEFATMVKQQVASCFAIIRTRAPGFDGVNDPSGMGYGYTQQQGGGYSRQVGGIAPGMEVLGEPGETVSGFSPNVPNPEYFKQISGIVRLIAANLGCPPEVSLFDTTQTTFHGYRGAVDEARRGFRRNQEWLKKRFHMPVYRWKVRQWMSEDATLRSRYAALGEKLFNHKWNPPTWAYIDPVKDADGDKRQLESGLISPRRWASGRGFDIDELNDEIVADNISRIRKAQEAANEFNEDYPDYPITWRDVLKPYESETVFSGKANLNEIADPQSPTTPTTPQTEDDPAESDDQGAEDDTDT